MKQTNTLHARTATETVEPEDEKIPYADRDTPPMTAEQLKKARFVPRVTSLRRAMRLTQEEFAERFKIPIGTLQDWEQERSRPDAPARAYLQLIAIDPAAVLNIFDRAPRRPAA